MTKWWGFFKTSPYISFIHTSGGQAHAESAQIKPKELAWATVSKITGKKIIADCGYGVGGADASNCVAWNDANRQARVKDGVIALSVGGGWYGRYKRILFKILYLKLYNTSLDEKIGEEKTFDIIHWWRCQERFASVIE